MKAEHKLEVEKFRNETIGLKVDLKNKLTDFRENFKGKEKILSEMKIQLE